MALKLKEFDFKQFLLEKGERVGLYVAGGLALLMIVLSLFLPGRGVFTLGRAGKTADDLNKTAKEKRNAVASAAPGAQEAKDLRYIDPQLQKQASNVAQDPAAHRLFAEMFAPREIPSNKRQNPTILAPDEYLVKFVPGQIYEYMMLEQNGELRVGVLTGTTRPTRQKDPFKMRQQFGGGGGSAGGGGAPPGFDPSKNRGSGAFGGPPGGGGDKPGAFGADDKKNLEVKYVRKDEAANMTYARDLLPLPMAVVVGSFPLKAQIEQFQKALRVESAHSVVFNETVMDKNVSRPGFGFRGVEVRRKTYGPDGKVIKDTKGDEWQPLDLESDSSLYVLTVKHVLMEFADEDPKLKPLLITGLYLPRPVQVPTRGGTPKPYPDVEMELSKIKDTVAALTPKQSQAVPKTKFDDTKFNPFRTPDAEADAGASKAPPPQEWAPPEYCVMRFLDVTLQPGMSYEYEVRILMQNPNYGKPDTEVANKQLATPKELASEWTPVKGSDGKMLRVSVPNDMYLYAVDELALRQKEYKGMAATERADPSRQTVLQVHRWMNQFEFTPPKGKPEFYPVGDWVVGERLIVNRGEYVGQKEVPAHVPVWAPEQNGFILAGKVPTRGQDKRPTEKMAFLEAKRAPLLVDFEGGTAIHRRGPAPVLDADGMPVDGSKTTPGTEVRELASTEVLLLTPDGRLLGHDSAADEKDEPRKEREEKYTRRVDEAAGTAKPEPAGGGKPDPFGGGKP
jgi:hypothetical protein